MPAFPSAPRSHVLVFGHDPSLLMTRCWLLAHLDRTTSSAAGMAEYRQRILIDDPALIILCQTLQNTERHAALALAAEHCPTARNLVLFGSRDTRDLPFEHVSLSAGVSPSDLLRVVDLILAGRAA